MSVVAWLVVLAIMLVIEQFTLGLTTIWFGVGSIGAALASWMGYEIWVQLIVFFILSLLSMVLCRPIAMRYLNPNKVKTNIDDLLGKTVVVTKEINNEQATGNVVLNGMDWMARSEDGCVIEEKEKAVVVAVEGVKLIVSRKERME